MEGVVKVGYAIVGLAVLVVAGWLLLPFVIGPGDPSDTEVLSNTATPNSGASGQSSVGQSGVGQSGVDPNAAGQTAVGDSGPLITIEPEPVTTTNGVDPTNRAELRDSNTPNPGSNIPTTVGASSSDEIIFFVTTSTPVAATDPTTSTTSPAVSAPVSTAVPQPADRILVEATLTEILVRETFPVLVDARIEGVRPSDCHRLATNGPRFADDGRIALEISAMETERECTSDDTAFTRLISLGELDAGNYTFVLNGVEFAFSV